MRKNILRLSVFPIMIAMLVCLLAGDRKPHYDPYENPASVTMETPVKTPDTQMNTPAPQPEPEPVPEPEPEPEVPQTIFELEDGFTIEVRGSYAAVIGYDDSLDAPTLPDTYEGVPITTIASGAFTDCERLLDLKLGCFVETIESGAFVNCTGLEVIRIDGKDLFISCYDEFSGCNAFALVLTGYDCIWYGDLPAQTAFCPLGLETPRGVIDDYAFENGVVYGITEQDALVVMKITRTVETLDLEEGIDGMEVLYMLDGALDGASSLTELMLASNMSFYPALLDPLIEVNATYTVGSRNHAWIYTCLAAEQYNSITSASAEADPALWEAAMVRSEELTDRFDVDYRPDERETQTVLDDFSIDWNWMQEYAYRRDPSGDGIDDAYDTAFEDLKETPYTEDGDPYTKIGIGIYGNEDNYYISILLIN